jgi:hypothetical protein
VVIPHALLCAVFDHLLPIAIERINLLPTSVAERLFPEGHRGFTSLLSCRDSLQEC